MKKILLFISILFTSILEAQTLLPISLGSGAGSGGSGVGFKFGAGTPTYFPFWASTDSLSSTSPLFSMGQNVGLNTTDSTELWDGKGLLISHTNSPTLGLTTPNQTWLLTTSNIGAQHYVTLWNSFGGEAIKFNNSNVRCQIGGSGIPDRQLVVMDVDPSNPGNTSTMKVVSTDGDPSITYYRKPFAQPKREWTTGIDNTTLKFKIANYVNLKSSHKNFLQIDTMGKTIVSNKVYIDSVGIGLLNVSIPKSPIDIGSGNQTSSDAAISLHRTNGNITNVAHGISLHETYAPTSSPLPMYSGYDYRNTINGSSAIDHCGGYQSAPTFTAYSGLLGYGFGYLSLLPNNSGVTFPITKYSHFMVKNSSIINKNITGTEIGFDAEIRASDGYGLYVNADQNYLTSGNGGTGISPLLILDSGSAGVGKTERIVHNLTSDYPISSIDYEVGGLYSGAIRMRVSNGSGNILQEKMSVESTVTKTANPIQFTTQYATTGAGVPNGSLFYGTNGALYFKGGSGTVTLIAPN